ncbi:MAG TPA: hypothetical protein VFJ82_25715 [Longimicrobium sp.]|nr:hypothetical protein [Longimicrobium sp.]
MEQWDEVEEARERAFWLAAKETAIRKIGVNSADDVYAQLLNGSTNEATE